MIFVYALFFEDPWDEYYEHKLHAIFSSFEKAETYAKSRKGEWHIEKISLDTVPKPEYESDWKSYQLYGVAKLGVTK